MSKFSNKVLWSLLHAVLLVVVTYFIWNIPDDWTDSGKWLQRIRLAKSIMAKNDALPEDLLLINTCYDHVMIPAYDELGMNCGQQDITDRTKLLKLLLHLASSDNYRYIVCDIDFNSELRSPADSLLFCLLENMPRCVVPRFTEGISLPAQLYGKSAISEYHTNISNNNFLKYQYLSSMGESIALRMAKELNNIMIDKHGPLYFIDGSVCVNALILDICTNVRSEYQQNVDSQHTIGGKNILQLGTEVLPMLDEGADGLFENKIIMIGDCFRDDIHTTVAGPTSGMMIIYNAYHALISKKNIPPLWVWFSLLSIYILLTFFIFCQLEPHAILPKNLFANHPLLSVAIDWIGFHCLFTIIGLLSFFCANIYIDAWLFASYFTVFEKVWLFVNSCNFHKNIKSKNNIL